jgi:surface antigen
MRKHYLTASIIAMVLVFSAMPQAGYAAGGINPFPSDVANLTQGEADAIKGAIKQALDTYKGGTVVNWTAADSKRTGHVKLLKIFDHNGQHCATVQNKFTKGAGNAYTLPFCQTADGSWKVTF